MKRTHIILLISLIICPLSLGASSLVWSGSDRNVISVTPPSSTGLEEVCVAYSTEGLKVAFPAASASAVRWMRYSNLGGGYAEEVTGVTFADGMSVLGNVEGDMGYIVETGGRQYCFWVVDYSRHRLAVSSISEATEKDCSLTMLDVEGSGDEIAYFSINGRRMTLDRDIRLAYRSLVADNENLSYTETQEEESLEYITRPLRVPAPLCPTEFTLTGDRFLKEWGEEVEVVSPTVQPYAVQAITRAEQTVRDADNEVGSGSDAGSFGGSAPCEIKFEAAVTDGALFREWQISSHQDFEDVDLRMSELSFTHTFTEAGTVYVRFMCANDDGTCEYYGDVYSVSIGASSLRCPNAFSPGNQDGVNDVWKVSYASIVSFECSIFNRNGRKIISFTDPSQGWDGKYNGKLVPTGAYYYVIKAKGADGKDYNQSGDINIVNYKY